LLPALFLVLIASAIYVLLLKPDSVNFGLGVIALSGLYVSNFALMFEGVQFGHADRDMVPRGGGAILYDLAAGP
jgi:peptidoglycan/LPS O-acetylase OafA/YrhL